jgi:hypothetical protein
VARCGHLSDTNVVGEIERPSIHPQRSALTPCRLMQDLTQPREAIQPQFDQRSHPADLDVAGGIQQTAAVQQAQRADVLGQTRSGHRMSRSSAESLSSAMYVTCSGGSSPWLPRTRATGPVGSGSLGPCRPPTVGAT